MVRDTSTPESTVVIVISLGSGTGARCAVSIAQLSAMLGRYWYVVLKGCGDGGGLSERTRDHIMATPGV